jgi:hypothetical protein
MDLNRKLKIALDRISPSDVVAGLALGVMTERLLRRISGFGRR